MMRRRVIQKAVDSLGKGVTYLEIGVLRGFVFTKIRAGRKIAVDPEFKISWRRRVMHFTNLLNCLYFEMPSDEFFRVHADNLFAESPVDVTFIDGLHTYEQSLRDVENALLYSSGRGIIIMHDCSPETPEMESPGMSGDVWKTIVHLRTMSDVEAFVLDEDCGLGVIAPCPLSATLSIDPVSIKEMSYADLESDRRNLLGLRSIEHFDSFLESHSKP